MEKKDKLAVLKTTWFGAIKTKDEAIRAIKESSNGFYAVAGLDIIIGIFLWKFYIIEGIIYLATSTILRFLKSRATAIVLFLISIAATISTIINSVNRTNGGGRNIFLALIVLGMSIRAIQATYKFHTLPECVVACKKLSKYMLIWGIILIPVSIVSFLLVSVLPYVIFNDEGSISAFFENPIINSLFGLIVILCITGLALTIEAIIIKVQKPKNS